MERSARYFWIMKKIIIISLHAGYWTIYVLLILLMEILISLMRNPVVTWHRFLYVLRHNPTGIFLIVPAVIAFYVFYTLLFSRFLKRKRLWLLLGSAAGTCVCAAVVTGFLVRLLFGLNFVSSADHFRLFIIRSTGPGRTWGGQGEARTGNSFLSVLNTAWKSCFWRTCCILKGCGTIAGSMLPTGKS
jgi:hypothetical protein